MVGRGSNSADDPTARIASDKGLASSPDEVKTLASLKHRYEGADGATRERMAWLRREVTNQLNGPQPELGFNQYSGGFGITKPSENDADYVIRRLKRDDPAHASPRHAGSSALLVMTSSGGGLAGG